MKMTKQQAGHLGGTAFGKVAKEQAKKRSLEKLESYYKNSNFCKQCGKIIEPVFTKRGTFDVSATIKKIFCNHSCSAIYNNPIKKTNQIPHKCENPNCNNMTKNERYCGKVCRGKGRTIQAIQRFLAGISTDAQVRKEFIRDFLVERQHGKCAICGRPPFWNNAPLVFIIDHIDGNYEHNSPENIRAICPNCNSQTDTFGGKNKTKHVIKRPTPNSRQGYKNK